MTSETTAPTYEELQARPPSGIALAICAFFVLAAFIADVIWAETFPTPMLMATSLLSGVAAMIFIGMAWTYRLSRPSLLVFGVSALMGIAVVGVNIYTLRAIALSE